jgi:hypothetical protein
MQIIKQPFRKIKKSADFFIRGKRRKNIFYLPSAVTKGIIAIIRERFIATANSL